MDFGLSEQRQSILRRARTLGLRGARRSQLLLPLWLIVVLSLLPLLLVWHPSRYLGLLLIPSLGLWHRRRLEERFQEWILDLRER